jgi:hypothetical protein
MNNIRSAFKKHGAKNIDRQICSDWQQYTRDMFNPNLTPNYIFLKEYNWYNHLKPH